MGMAPQKNMLNMRKWLVFKCGLYQSSKCKVELLVTVNGYIQSTNDRCEKSLPRFTAEQGQN